MKQFTIDNSQLTIKILTLFLILSIVHFQFSIPVFAADQDPVGYSRIHPASPLYFLKTIRENLELKFAATGHVKLLRQLEFAQRRLREVRTLIAINEDLIPPTIERYNFYINSLNDTHKDTEELRLMQSNLANNLKTLQLIYGQAVTPRAKMFIRSAMNRVIQRADVPNFAKVPICNLFTKESSSSALNQTERLVLVERAEKCRLMLMP